MPAELFIKKPVQNTMQAALALERHYSVSEFPYYASVHLPEREGAVGAPRGYELSVRGYCHAL